MAENQETNHSFRYEKGKLYVTGVMGVDSYDDKTVEIRLSGGLLNVSGSNFSLEEMNLKSGQLIVNGALHTLSYRDKGEKVGILKRLLK